METSGFRHQGLMYHGSPSHHMRMMAAVMKARLEQKHRCLYFDSERMVAGLRFHLAQIGVDVARETAQNSLVTCSHLGHLGEDQTFDVDRMIATLEDALKQALHDGYVGLWASGDIAWEFGPKLDFEQLRQYEVRLEEFVCAHPQMSGICQYHADALTPSAMQIGHETHPSFFINETQSQLNLAYRASNRVAAITSVDTLLDLYLSQDIHRRASDCANSRGITLNEFINQAIAEKLYPADNKSLKN